MSSRNFLSIGDLTVSKILSILNRAGEIKNGTLSDCLQDKIIALIFEKPSLRTRVSFEVGIRQMGGQCIYLSKEDVGLGDREPVEDVARVLDRWVDGIVARVFSHQNLQVLAEHTSIPVVNALSDLEHPCQAIGDLLTIQEHKRYLDNLNLTFVGDGNNVASSLALACASVGMNFVLSSPEDYQIPIFVLEEARRRGCLSGAKVQWIESPELAIQDADVVYTDVWVSMGQESEETEKAKAFSRYQVNEVLMNGARQDAIFMHDMPAHRGQEISGNMLTHPQSVVFDQAENRLHAQKAILVDLFSE